jgi:RNA polymerase sigma-70 factor (ECF subfamily)
MLQHGFVLHGGPEHFERLKVFLLGQSEAPYATLAREMNTSERALKVAIHSLRKRYRDLARKSPIPWPIPTKWNPNSDIWRSC